MKTYRTAKSKKQERKLNVSDTSIGRVATIHLVVHLADRIDHSDADDQ